MKNSIQSVLKMGDSTRLMKNVVVISLAFMLHFTAYSGAANLQSSINAVAGLGTASLAAVYAGLITSNLFLPVLVIRWLGCKWAMALSFITYMPYIAAQLHPRFWTLVPAGLMVGFGGGPLWCAKCSYLFLVSEAKSKLSGISAEFLLVRFLGIFFMIFQMNQVWGNLISSLVLSSGGNAAAVTSVNATMIPLVCGANFLPSTDAGEVLQQQPQEKLEIMTGIYLACMAAASLLVAVGVDSSKGYESDLGDKDPGAGQSTFQMLAVTMRLMMEPKQLLLVTINIFIGLQQAFFGADFTAAFVSCAIGTGTVGYVMMTYGLSNAIGCMGSGFFAKITGRMPLIAIAIASHTALFSTVLLWKPNPGEVYVTYIIAIIWGMTDSLWLVQMNGYYGILFPGREAAAFSNFRLWESVGFIIAYIISPILRFNVKIYILLVLMYVGSIGYFTVEYQETRISRKKLKIEDAIDEKGYDNSAFQVVERF